MTDTYIRNQLLQQGLPTLAPIIEIKRTIIKTKRVLKNQSS
jgi:hypothetical protein